jgi:hypothetical protein
VKLALILSVFPLPPHEPVVEYARPTCVGRASSHRLDRQATIRFSPHTFPSWLDPIPGQRHGVRRLEMICVVKCLHHIFFAVALLTGLSNLAAARQCVFSDQEESFIVASTLMQKPVCDRLFPGYETRTADHYVRWQGENQSLITQALQQPLIRSFTSAPQTRQCHDDVRAMSRNERRVRRPCGHAFRPASAILWRGDSGPNC